MKIGTVKKTVLVFYDVVLKNGKKIRLANEQVKLHGILDGQKVTGKCRTEEKQYRYTNGEYARFYSIHEYFDIDKVEINEQKDKE